MIVTNLCRSEWVVDGEKQLYTSINSRRDLKKYEANDATTATNSCRLFHASLFSSPSSSSSSSSSFSSSPSLLKRRKSYDFTSHPPPLSPREPVICICLCDPVSQSSLRHH